MKNFVFRDIASLLSQVLPISNNNHGIFVRRHSCFLGSSLKSLFESLQFQCTSPLQPWLVSRHLAYIFSKNNHAILSRRRVSTNTAEISSVDRALSFDLKISASKKTIPELLRAVGVLAVCRIKPVVVHAETLVKLCKRFLGHNITLSFIRYSVFKHFCGGERMEQLIPLITSLETEGVGSVIAYSVEDDLVDEQKSNIAQDISTWNLHCEHLKESAKAASNQEFGFVAIKLTALISPEDLKLASNCIVKVHNIFGEIAGLQEKSTAGYMMTDQLVTLKLTKNEFFNKAHQHVDCANLDEVFCRVSSINAQDDLPKTISYFQWMKFFSLDYPENLRLLKRCTNMELEWNEENSTRWKAAFYRFRDVIDVVAQQKNVAALLDAEQTYFQPAIDVMTSHVQELFNKDRCVLYNTYQSYRKDCFSRAKADMQRATFFKYTFGMKLVRGAYMLLERQLAARGGFIDPINNTKEETRAMFQKMTYLAFSEPDRIAVFFGTHNAESILHILDVMKSKGITGMRGTCSFGQLLGMFDHVTFTLSHFGYYSYKYVPYGPIDEVIPYLVRRAQENSDILSSCTEELRYFTWEIFHRITPFRRNPRSTSL